MVNFMLCIILYIDYVSFNNSIVISWLPHETTAHFMGLKNKILHYHVAQFEILYLLKL